MRTQHLREPHKNADRLNVHVTDRPSINNNEFDFFFFKFGSSSTMLPTIAKAGEPSAVNLMFWLFYIGMKCVRYLTTLILSFLSYMRL